MSIPVIRTISLTRQVTHGSAFSTPASIARAASIQSDLIETTTLQTDHHEFGLASIKITVKSLIGYVREYNRRCNLKPQLQNGTSEVNMIKNIISRYHKTEETLCEKDIQLLLFICQNNADNRTNHSHRFWGDWLISQICLDTNLEDFIVQPSAFVSTPEVNEPDFKGTKK